MKRILSMVCMMIMMSVGGVAADNAIKGIIGGKLGTGVGSLIRDIEYERAIFPLTRGYLRLGGVGFDVPGATSVRASVSNMAAGLRWHVLFFYIGVGYESSQLDLKKDAQKASGTINGPSVEMGQQYGLGPIIFGGSVGAHFARVDISYDDTVFGIGDMSKYVGGESVTLLKAEVFVGVSF